MSQFNYKTDLAGLIKATSDALNALSSANINGNSVSNGMVEKVARDLVEMISVANKAAKEP